jgi:hypothetical protein
MFGGGGMRIGIGMVLAAVFALSTAPSRAQEYFHGYECTVDCSGHEAGYDWAATNGITDPNQCGGDSQSFIEGCQAFAEENYAPSGDRYGSDGDDGDSSQPYQDEGDDSDE